MLKRDQKSCDTILKAILKEKQEEDIRKQIRNQEKFINRNKTVYRHNKQLKNLESIGVKVRHHSITKGDTADPTTSKEYNLTSDTSNGEATFGAKRRNSTFGTSQMIENA